MQGMTSTWDATAMPTFFVYAGHCKWCLSGHGYAILSDPPAGHGKCMRCDRHADLLCFMQGIASAWGHGHADLPDLLAGHGKCMGCDRHADLLCFMQGIASACGVTAMPTFQIFRQGRKVEEVRGADVKALLALLERYNTMGAFSGQGRTLAGGASTRLLLLNARPCPIWLVYSALSSIRLRGELIVTALHPGGCCRNVCSI